MQLERLTAEDRTFFALENEYSAMHNVTVAVFEGPEPDFDAIAERVAERVPLVPRFRQRVLSVPFDFDKPVWVDDPHFSLSYHVRHTGLPARGGRDALDNLVGRILSQRLDRGKPLWEIWVVSGLQRKRWALISKAHHSIIDGVSGMDPLTVVVDRDRTPRKRRDNWNPQPLPSGSDLVSNAIRSVAFNPARQARIARRAIERPLNSAKKFIESQTAPETPPPLTGDIGPHRVWHSTSVGFSEVNKLREESGATTNDVILALLTCGYRALLKTNDAEVPGYIRTLVPLAVSASRSFSNEITAQRVDLPTGLSDLRSILAAVSNQTGERIDQTHAVSGSRLANLDGFAAPTLYALGVRSATREGLRSGDIQTVTVNSPGPAQEISFLGQPMLEVTPAMPLVARTRIATGVVSYLDRFHFGITGDRDANDDIDAVAAGIKAAVEDM